MRPLLIATREMKSLFTDKSDMAFSLLLPVVLLALMVGAFGGNRPFEGTAYVVDRDTGPYASRLLEDLRSIQELTVKVLPEDDAQEMLSRSDVLQVFYIPEDFSESLSKGQPSGLTLRRRGNGGLEGQVVETMVRSALQELNNEVSVQSDLRAFADRAGVPLTSEELAESTRKVLENLRQNPAMRVEETQVGKAFNAVTFFLPGLVSMFVLFGVSLTASSIVHERNTGTLERLLVGGATPNDIFFGKLIANFWRGVLHVFILFGLAYLVFGLFTPASFAQLILFAFVSVFAVCSSGMLIGSIGRTASQAAWISVFFTMTMSAFGGTFFDAGQGGMLGTIAKFTYNYYANRGYRLLISEGKSLASLNSEVLILALIGLTSLLIARLIFRVAQEGR